jgi:rod shape-determining protein MreD
MLDVVNRPIVRILLVGLPALGLQTTFLAGASLAGIVVQLMLCLSVAAGVAGGSERGAVTGFALGLMFDLVLSTPLGLTALVYGLAGFLAGYVNSLSINHPWWIRSIVVGSTSSAVMFVHPVLATWVGVDGWLTTRVIKVAIIVGLANAVIALAAVPAMRWALAIKRQERLAPPPEIYA